MAINDFVVVTDRTDKSIARFFQVAVKPGYTLVSDSVEEKYFNGLQAALEAIANDLDQEAWPDVRLLPDALDTRNRARESAVASLRSDAESNLTAEAGLQNIDKINTQYRAQLDSVPDGRQRFSTKEDNARFAGYFTIDESPWFSPEDKNYRDLARGLLKYLAEEGDKDQDALAPDSPKMIWHNAARQSAALQLKFDVENVGSFLTAQAATTRAADIRSKYDEAIKRIDKPKLKIEDRPEVRFVGDFDLKEGATQEDSDREDSGGDFNNYIVQVKDVLRRLALDEREDKVRNYAESILAERRKLRKATADELRNDAELVSKGSKPAIRAASAASTALGRYLHKLELASAKLFTVTAEEDKDKKDRLAINLQIDVTPDLPPPNNVASPEKQELYTAILAAQTVVKTVCKRIEDGDDKTLCGRLFGAPQNTAPGIRAALLRNEYLRRLAGIGELGLEGPNTTLAKVALDSLRNEFVAHEGPRIKNSYVCRLGFVCAIAAVAFLIAYLAIVAGFVEHKFWGMHKPFLLAGTGAAIGTWLSFSIREVELSFDHLGVVEADLLDPAFRVLFVVALTITACLLFWTGVMNIEIGGLTTTSKAFERAGTIPLLIGLFCGLSERGLATAVSGRAASFVKGIGGA